MIQLELYRIGSDHTNTAVTYSPIQLWPAMVEQLVEHECWGQGFKSSLVIRKKVSHGAITFAIFARDFALS